MPPGTVHITRRTAVATALAAAVLTAAAVLGPQRARGQDAEPLGRPRVVLDDRARGVTCYLSTGTGDAMSLSCVRTGTGRQ